MTAKAYAARQQRIREGRCPRCNKPVDTWPLRRPDNCGPARTVCYRAWPDIIDAERRLTVKD